MTDFHLNYCKMLWDFLGAIVLFVAPITVGFLAGCAL